MKTKMSKQLVFIDDSGDPGFKKGASSANLIMAAVFFDDTEHASLVNEAISAYRNSLGWKENHEFKFRTTSKSIKFNFLKIVNQYNFEIYAVYINKSEHSNVFRILDDRKLYNWITKELLSLMPLKNAQIKMDGKYDKRYKLRLKTYIRQEVNTASNKKVKSFDDQDSRRDNLIQLADIVAESINRSLQTEKTDSKYYINIIKKKIVKLVKLKLSSR